jgi:hypothetical protein
MFRKMVLVWAAMAVVLALNVSLQADTVSYTETFQNTFSATNSFMGSASPNPTWSVYNQTTGAVDARDDAAVATAGTLTLTNGWFTAATVSASGLLGAGHTAFDVSAAPLTVSGIMSANSPGQASDAGNCAAGLVVGDLYIVAWSNLSGLERVYSGSTQGSKLDEHWLGPVGPMGVPYPVTATIAEQDSTHYLLTYGFGTEAPHTLSVLKTDAGNLDQVGIYFEALSGGTTFVTSFSVSQVPEPGTITLVVSGLIGLLAYAWRRRK